LLPAYEANDFFVVFDRNAVVVIERGATPRLEFPEAQKS